MAPDLGNIYDELYSYCKKSAFAGHDPFDGLNSRIFQHLPFMRFRVARLTWLQAIKRSPIDLRDILQIKKGVNAKGLALFALAELSRFRTTKDAPNMGNACDIIDRLLETKIAGETADGRPMMAFGYNFDWQSRSFFVPLGTPAIVPTAFASQAFIDAYDIFGDEKYLDAADDICRFILTSLNRIDETDDEVCFSYTSLDRSVIFNASLLAGECLSRVGVRTGNVEYLTMAAKATRFVVRRQRSDGVWIYGAGEKQTWVDNFHTAYVLLSLYRISGDIDELRSETFDAIGRGVNYWLNNFFLGDGTPKYFDNETFPVDIHSAAVAISTMCELKAIDGRMLPTAQKVAAWTIVNMRDPDGYFYYQKRKSRTIKTPFMRWGQAWMAYALARLVESDG